MWENSLIRKLRQISKFMTSQTRGQTIIFNLFLDISKSKSNQTMKFSQLIEYNRNIFLQIYAKNEVGKLVPDLFLFFLQVLYELKVSGQDLSFYMF